MSELFDKLTGFGPVAWVIGNWQIVAGAALLLGASHSLAYCTGVSDGKDIKAAEYARAEREARELDAESKGIAAKEEEAATAAIDEQEQEANDAITEAGSKGIDPSAASDAIMCVRLRRTDPELYKLSACAGRAGRD